MAQTEDFVTIRRSINAPKTHSYYYNKKILDKTGTCVGCTGVSPFVMTSEYDILSKNKSQNIFNASQIMCSALHSGSKDLISMKTNLKRDEIVITAADLIKSYKHTEGEGDDNDVEDTYGTYGDGSKILKSLSGEFFGKVKLLGHYACAVRSLHEMGYFHLNIEPRNLLIRSGKGGTGEISGILHNFENATAFSKKTDRFVLTKTSRGHPIFRPPEHHIIHRVEGQRGVEGNLHFKIDEKFDVWSLGMCFLHLLTELPVFVIHPGRPHLSSKGAERIENLEARKDTTKKQIVHAIINECVRWQTFRLFGSTGSPDVPLSENDKNESDLKRKISIDAMIGGAVRRGLIPNDYLHPQLCKDLLFKMLNPNSEDRITIQEVCIHPLFKDYLSHHQTTFPITTSTMQTLPFDHWTREKDEAVVETMHLFIRSPETSHLSVESVFVLFDMLIRIANGVDKEKAKTKSLKDSLLAASKVCFSLYDFSPFPILYENDVTHALEPVVIEYLKGDLRRPEYLYDHLYTKEQVETLLKLMVTASDENAYVFRENYGKLDMKKFVGELFGKGYHLLSTERRGKMHQHQNIKIHHIVPDFLTSS